MTKTPSPPNEQTKNATQENSCVESATKSTLGPKSLRLLIATLRRLLVGAIRVCDEIAAQLKTK